MPFPGSSTTFHGLTATYKEIDDLLAGDNKEAVAFDHLKMNIYKIQRPLRNE